MKLFHIDEARQFVQRIDKCRGEVFMRMENGEKLDLKNAADRRISTIRNQIEKGKIAELDLCFACGTDAITIAQCLF